MEGKPTITTFTDGLKTEVIDLWEKCNLLFPGNDPAYDIEVKMNFQPGLFFTMTLEGRLIGSVMAGFDGHRGWLNYLCVHPDYRSRGYGKILVMHSIEELKKLGCPKVNLQVRNTNTGVIDFYKKAGFYMHDVVCMQYKI